MVHEELDMAPPRKLAASFAHHDRACALRIEMEKRTVRRFSLQLNIKTFSPSSLMTQTEDAPAFVGAQVLNLSLSHVLTAIEASS